MNRLLAFLLCTCAVTAMAEEPVRVFAAASLTDALGDAAKAWEAQGHATPRLAFGGSSALAKQIDAGAPADVFVSADVGWMDYLAERNRLLPGTRRTLLGNTLVLVAPKGRAPAVKLERGFDFAAAFEGKLCTGEPGVVPVGIYAKQALEHFGWWAAIAPRIVGAEDVRTALSFVERGECSLGIVYATDAQASDAVETLAAFPADSHAPIAYPIALLHDAREGNAAFVEWLAQDPGGFAIFLRHGFTRPVP